MEDKLDQRKKRGNVAFIKVFFIAAVAIGTINYVATLIPSEKDMCTKSCSAHDKRGLLVYKYSYAQTAGMRGRGPTECHCEP